MGRYQKALRLLLALAGLIIFWLAAVLAIIIARGNTITEDGITQTGSLRLLVEPSSGLQVYLDEQQRNIGTNNIIENIDPGTYQLRLSKEGYSNWEEEVEVKKGLITDIRARLFPTELELEQLVSADISQVFYSPRGRYVYYTVTTGTAGADKGLWRYSTQQNVLPLVNEQPIKITNFTSAISEQAEAGELELVISPDDTRLLLTAAANTYLLDANRYNEPAANNLLEFSFPLDSLSWLNNSTSLLMISDNLAFEYALNTEETTLITYTENKPIIATNPEITYVYQSGKLFRYQNEKLTEISLENLQLPANVTSIHIAHEVQQELLLQTDTAIYLLNIPTSNLVQLTTGSLISFAPDGQRLLVKADAEILSVRINTSDLSNTITPNVMETQLPENIILDSINWANSSNYFIFRITGENGLYTADASGNNVNKRLESVNISELKLGITEDSNGIIVPVSNEDNTSNLSQLQLR